MTDCDSNGQRPFTKYEALCCSPSNKGDIIHATKDNGHTGYVICPDTIPKWCPLNSCYDILQTVYNSFYINYFSEKFRIMHVLIYYNYNVTLCTKILKMISFINYVIEIVSY